MIKPQRPEKSLEEMGLIVIDPQQVVSAFAVAVPDFWDFIGRVLQGQKQATSTVVWGEPLIVLHNADGELNTYASQFFGSTVFGLAVVVGVNNQGDFVSCPAILAQHLIREEGKVRRWKTAS